MPPSKSQLAYADVREALDRALESDRGIAVGRTHRGAAVNMRQRCYALVKLLREQSFTLYDEKDARYGTTPWDVLTFTVRDVPPALLIHKRSTADLEIKEL